MIQKQRLGDILQGRTIQSTQNKNGAMTVGFSDGSEMQIGTGLSSSPSAEMGGTVRSVTQTQTSLHLELVNGKALTIPLPTNETTILVQNKDGDSEYNG